MGYSIRWNVSAYNGKRNRFRHMPMLQKQRLFSADKLPMEVRTTIEVVIKVDGVTFSFVFSAIENLREV
jgi:hypothetical protein